MMCGLLPTGLLTYNFDVWKSWKILSLLHITLHHCSLVHFLVNFQKSSLFLNMTRCHRKLFEGFTCTIALISSEPQDELFSVECPLGQNIVLVIFLIRSNGILNNCRCCYTFCRDCIGTYFNLLQCCNHFFGSDRCNSSSARAKRAAFNYKLSIFAQ